MTGFETIARQPLPEVRRALLPGTLEYCARTIPYYGARWGDAWLRVQEPAGLVQLPLLIKEEAIEHQEDLLAGPIPHFVGVISSGTSHGERRPLRVPRTLSEHAVRLAFEELRHPSAGIERPLVLEVRSMQHGIPEYPPLPHTIRVPWAFTANTLRLLRELLARPQPDGRWVTGLIISSPALTALTAHLLETGVDPSTTFRVREIGTNGARLPASWRALVEKSWGATLFDNYSLSELATPALECKQCGYNHWRLPPLVFEVLDVFTREPLSEGTGVLVLTTLYPFVQALPLIRYWTGDLVELGPVCEHTGERGVLCRGRLSQTLVEPGVRGDPILLSPLDVEDWLNGSPLVARHEHPMRLLGLIHSPEIGVVKFDLQRRTPTTVVVQVELRFDPRIYPESSATFAEQLRAELIRRNGRLRMLLERRELDLEIELVAPGRLEKRWSKY